MASPPCTCIFCSITSKMLLRHCLSSLGVTPRLDARPVLKNRSQLAVALLNAPAPPLVFRHLLCRAFGGLEDGQRFSMPLHHPFEPADTTATKVPGGYVNCERQLLASHRPVLA